MTYYTKHDTDNNPYIKTPKFLFTDPKYINLSVAAKLLYGLILDRLTLSQKNNWVDNEGFVFVIYTVEETAKVLNCSEDTATKVLRELESVKLILRKRRGQGLPSIIYVYNISVLIPKKDSVNDNSAKDHTAFVDRFSKTCTKFSVLNSNTEVCGNKTPKNPVSRTQKNQIQEAEKNGTIKHNSNKTDNSNLNSISPRADEIKKQIDYTSLCNEYGQAKADKVITVIADVTTGKRSVKADGTYIDKEEAKRIYTKLSYKEVSHVLTTMSRIAVYSPTSWLGTALYNVVKCAESHNTQGNYAPRTVQYAGYQTYGAQNISHEPSFDLDAIMEYAKNTPLKVRTMA